MNSVLDCVWQAVRAAGEAVCLCDATNHFVQVNEPFRRLYGWEPAELAGESPLKLVPADGDLGLVREINRATRTVGGWTGTLPNVRRDGTPVPIRLRTAACARAGKPSASWASRGRSPQLRWWNCPRCSAASSGCWARDWPRRKSLPPCPPPNPPCASTCAG